MPFFPGPGTEYLGIPEVELNTFSLWSVRGGQWVLEMESFEERLNLVGFLFIFEGAWWDRWVVCAEVG